MGSWRVVTGAAYSSRVANVKGSALASRVLWLRLQHGEAGLDRVLAQCSPELKGFVDSGIAKARWYPFDRFVEFNLVIDRLFGKGDLELIRQLGRFSADANLTTIYRLFFKVGTTQWILARGARLWSAHYDSGDLEVQTPGKHDAVLRFHGFATPHRALCLTLAGWCQRSIELSGGANVQVTEARCRLHGDDVCQLDAAWQ